ncbi:MAG: hypothetical protein WKG06_08660 [Segetibacter sp.]
MKLPVACWVTVLAVTLVSLALKKLTTFFTLPLNGPYFFTPINEITFFSFCGGEWGWVAPYSNTRNDRYKLRYNLCKAAICGVKAIRDVEPEARMIHIDPLSSGSATQRQALPATVGRPRNLC